MLVMLTTALAVLAVYFVWYRGHGQTHSVPSYFFNAVKVYALLGEEDAKIAALAAGKVATPRQRTIMLDYLNNRTSALLLETEEDNVGQNPLLVVDRLLQLKTAITTQDDPNADVSQEKQWLNDHNQAYLRGLDRGDPTVFVAQHPDLFSTQTDEQVITKNDE
jgi:hypothetical protein